MKVLALLLALWPALVSAQDLLELPALYDVTGVASNDVLNVRAGPSGDTDIVGEFAPDAERIEVLYTNGEGTWGRVNAGETAGWVSMTYLMRRPGQIAGAKLPLPLSCYGTEPFWGLKIGETQTVFTDPGTDEPPLTFVTEFIGSQPWTPRGGFAAGDITGFVTQEYCDDGMSDREFGYRVDFIRVGNGGHYMFSGCCTMQR